MLNKIKTIFKMFLENCSPKYSEHVTSVFWNNATDTHSDMSDNAFKFYYEEISKLLSPKKSDEILDYGCGSAEITGLFLKNGYKIDCCDISTTLIENAKKNGLNANYCDEVLKDGKKYNMIFINNAFFYVHPFKRKKLLFSLFNKLKDGGTLYILDDPDYNKRHKLEMNKAHYIVTKLFPIYQVELAGFFNKFNKMKQTGINVGFKDVITCDSWCYYRSHFILKK